MFHGAARHAQIVVFGAFSMVRPGVVHQILDIRFVLDQSLYLWTEKKRPIRYNNMSSRWWCSDLRYGIITVAHRYWTRKLLRGNDYLGRGGGIIEGNKGRHDVYFAYFKTGIIAERRRRNLLHLSYTGRFVFFVSTFDKSPFIPSRTHSSTTRAAQASTPYTHARMITNRATHSHVRQ